MARNVDSKKALFDSKQFASIGTTEPSQEDPAVGGKNAGRMPPGAKPTQPNKCDWDNKKTIKKSIYLTKKADEALRLRHAIMPSDTNDFSSIINEALEKYLAAEISALDTARENTTSDHSRYQKALSLLISGS